MRLRVPGWSPPAEVSLHFSKLQEQNGTPCDL
jgi:hypothetical protein